MSQDNKFVRSLIQSALQGNKSALEQLYSMNLSRIFTLTFRLTANVDSANKLTQDILVEAWKQLSYLREDATFSSWIFSITVYQSLKYLRENNNARKFDAAYLASKDPLEKSILDLPKTERIVFVLHYFEKYTMDEIADLLAIKNSEAKNYLDECEKLLKVKHPELSSTVVLAENIKRIKVDLKPNENLIKQALISIYRIKSEDEFKDEFLSEQSGEKPVKDEKESGQEEKEKKGFGGLFKKKKSK